MGGKGGSGSPQRDAGSGPISGSAALPSNCHRNPVGSCCTTHECFDPEALAALIGRSTLSQPADMDAGAPGECPDRIQLSFCDHLTSVESAPEGECCYTRVKGTCCGRPLVVGERMLAAELRTRTDWLGESAPIGAHLDRITREELARAWLEDARLEHASIASFARFTLHALSLGAPSDLITDAQRAGLDEVDHARRCFALASRLAEAPIGPGRFPMDGVLATTTLAGAAAAAVREGCVGETVASVVAQAQLGWATEPHVRAALARIADDEARHAELAYRFVRWAIATGGVEVRDRVAEAFRDGLAALRAEQLRRIGEVAVDAWHDHGRLTPREEQAAWFAAARDVIEPCARELLG